MQAQKHTCHETETYIKTKGNVEDQVPYQKVTYCVTCKSVVNREEL